MLATVSAETLGLGALQDAEALDLRLSVTSLFRVRTEAWPGLRQWCLAGEQEHSHELVQIRLCLHMNSGANLYGAESQRPL